MRNFLNDVATTELLIRQIWPFKQFTRYVSTCVRRDTTSVLLLTVALTVALKLFYSNAGPGELKWMLYPVARLVQAFTSIDFLFVPQKGYEAINAPIVIGPGCAGLNFYVVALCMVIFSFITSLARKHIYWFLFFVLVTYVVTVVVNAFRIMGGIMLLELTSRMGFEASEVIHGIQGTLFYFVFLVLYFVVMRGILERRKFS